MHEQVVVGDDLRLHVRRVHREGEITGRAREILQTIRQRAERDVGRRVERRTERVDEHGAQRVGDREVIADRLLHERQRLVERSEVVEPLRPLVEHVEAGVQGGLLRDGDRVGVEQQARLERLQGSR